MKRLFIIVLIISSISSIAATRQIKIDKERESRLESVITNSNGDIIRKYRKSGRPEIKIPEADENHITIVLTNSEGNVVNAYSRLVRSSAKSSKRLINPVVGNSTNYVLYTKPIDYFKYKPEHIDYYVENTNDTNNSELVLRANSETDIRIANLENQIASNRLEIATAELAGDTNTVVKLNKRILRLQRLIDRLNGIHYEDGGYYYMKDGTVITYRTAVNYGFAGDPTNDIMRACYNSITNDPRSLWSVRKLDRENPMHDSRNKSSNNPNLDIYKRRR